MIANLWISYPQGKILGAKVSYSAIVLAGGFGRRMGGVTKPLLAVAGESMLDRVLRAVSDADHIVVVGPDELAGHLPGGVRLTQERPAGTGPVAGIAAGLNALRQWEGTHEQGEPARAPTGADGAEVPTDEARPGADETQADVEGTQPGSGQTQWGAGEAPSAAGVTRPGAGETRPHVGERLPGGGRVRPGGSETAPGGEEPLGVGEGLPGGGGVRPGGSEAAPGGRPPSVGGTRPGGGRVRSGGSGAAPGGRMPGGGGAVPGDGEPIGVGEGRPGGGEAASGERPPSVAGTRPGGNEVWSGAEGVAAGQGTSTAARGERGPGSGLRDEDLVVVVGGDLPFLTTGALALLRQSTHDVAVYVDDEGRRQPMAMVWSVRALEGALAPVPTSMNGLMNNARRITEVPWRGTGMPPWYDCDTPEELAEAERRLS